MKPSDLDQWRVVPRLMVCLYGFMCWQTYDWFTGLADPSMPQTTFATAIWGAAAAWFGFYVNSGPRPPRNRNPQEPDYGYHDDRVPHRAGDYSDPGPAVRP